MDEILQIILQMISGISWTLVYLILIIRGFKDKTYGMPFYALALNFIIETKEKPFLQGWDEFCNKMFQKSIIFLTPYL